MLKNAILGMAVLVVLGACSVASADNFRLSYGNRGQAITGYTTPSYGGGFNAYGYDTSGRTYRFNYQPSFYPSYGYQSQPTYYAPVMNDYYRSSPYQGYGFKSW